MNRLIILTVILFSTISLYSQNFRLGFQASPHLTWMYSPKANNNELSPGIKYGLEADLFIAGFPRYSVNTGLFVANHSFSASYYNIEEPFKINDNEFADDVMINFKMNYLEVPLNVKLKSDQIYRMNFYGQFGLTNLFNLSASATSNNGALDGDNVNENTIDYEAAISRYSLNMLIGGGVEYDLGGNTALNVGIQYSNGLTDITNFENLNEETKINALRLVLGVLF